ncbi:MAG: hypothetical protein ACTSVI_09970 [Promethearchaeota archaeon]
MENKEEDTIIKEEMDFIEHIESLLDKIMDDSLGIRALAVGSHSGTIITSKFRVMEDIDPKEMVAATASLLFISKQAVGTLLDEELNMVSTFSPTYIFLSYITRNITFGVVLERNLVDLDGIERYIDNLKETALKISAIIEISDIEYGDAFTKIKVAIPDATAYAIITKEGLPLKIQSEKVDDARLAAFISAIFNVNDLITHEEPEFTTLVGEKNSIIIHTLDNTRLLAVAVPTGDNNTLMKYILRIKSLVSEL